MNITKKSKYNFNLSSITPFEVAISGILFALFMLFFAIKKTLFPGPLNIEIEHLFYILVGLIFPLLYGVFFAFMCDFAKMLFQGRLYDWSYVYAIAPPLIVIVSWLFFSFYRKNRIAMLIFASFLLVTTMYLNIIFVAYNSNNDVVLKKLFNIDKKSDFNRNLASYTLIIISLIYSLFTTIFILSVWIKYSINKRKAISSFEREYANNKLLTLFMIFVLVAFVSVLFRWAYGNFSLVHWINTRRAITGSDKPQIPYFSSEYFAFGIWMIIKSGFETLIFTSILIPLYSVLNILKQRYMIDLKQIKW